MKDKKFVALIGPTSEARLMGIVSAPSMSAAVESVRATLKRQGLTVCEHEADFPNVVWFSGYAHPKVPHIVSATKNHVGDVYDVYYITLEVADNWDFATDNNWLPVEDCQH